ncbi:uncharacterized protein LOC106877571 [Octopus bimaculoides]|uniref:ubiquitinyl hydrolase 1 n=1 Tax=Octopus bimaculoides TaxID=37653 RepID=A0A0L8GDK5_OCTBM|nr:uncharacterized protein LOC106877571 [Octopus bimaculoides]|eukprot:XP_014781994.1 PREDICTED: uncharacterized protein LOC106877571 [Octopus bimaculoides]
MPAVVMDIEGPSCSRKQVTDDVIENVHISSQNLLFDVNLDSAENSDLFNEMPSLDQEASKSDFELLPSIGPLHRNPKDIESPSASNGCCGFYNLGNTCFMNAGLQCLFCNMHLVKYFHEQFVFDDLTKDTLTGKFCQLVRKVWSGHFSLIHPLDFKNTLGMYYPQFQDFRQHDCQEFVTLLLDNLHESLNNVCCNNRNIFQNPLPTSDFIKTQGYPLVDDAVTSSVVALSSFSSTVSSSCQSTAEGTKVLSSGLQLQNQNNSHVSSSQIDIHRTTECNSLSKNPTKLSMGNTIIYQNCNSSLKKPFHFTENQLYTESNNTNSASLTINHSNTSHEQELVASSCSTEVTSVCSELGTDKGKAQISPLRNFERSPNKDTNKMLTVESRVSSSTQPLCCAANSSSEEATVINRRAINFASNNQSLIQPCSQPTAVQFNDQSFVDSTHVNGSGESTTTLALGLKCLPSLEDFYAKETKTLNTNMLASESEEQIKTDSEKFIKSDNRIRRNPENCDNNIEQIIGAEAAKAELAPGIEKLKDINIRLDKKTRCHQNYPCTSGLPYEDWSNINNIKRIKIESDVDEKNMKRQALQKFNLEQSTLRSDEVMTTPSCSVTLEDDDEEEEEEERDEDDEEEEAMSGGDESVIERQDSEWLEEKQASKHQSSNEINRNLPLAEHCRLKEGLTAADIDAANVSWESHLVKNNSIVVSTFHGQFKNTVICSECCHVSVTYEPFMYLSVPIPHAMERQLCVIFITQTRTIPPIRYLLKLHKNDNIYKAKTELRKMAGQQNCDIIMVEVVNNYISRVLDDNILLRFVNDSARKIYAFQMAVPPNSLDSSPSDNLGKLPTANSSLATKESIATKQTSSSKSPDIFSNMDTFCPSNCSPQKTTSMSTTESDVTPQSNDSSNLPLLSRPSLDPVLTPQSQSTLTTNMSTSAFPDSIVTDDACVCDSSSVTTQSKTNDPDPDSMQTDQIWDWSLTTDNSKRPAIPMSWESAPSANLSSIAEHWRSCAICLEELLDTSLMVHTSCSGTFCHSCLEMSLKHHSVFSYTCPVCLAFVNPSVEFVPLADPDSKRLRTRILAVPLTFRCLSKSNPEQQQLIGHPHILYLPNNISGGTLYNCVNQIVHTALQYTIAFTMEEGLQCSRCPSVNQCVGCVVQRTGQVTLQPGDHLTITFVTVPAEQGQLLEQCVIDHESMENLRPNTPMSLHDCFTAFMQSETLDEHNPWYCPNCSKNCRAKKTMTVWRYPDNLIIYLKRFVFHELTSTKIDNLVTFPLEDLDLSQFTSGPHTKNLLYDLHSFVCHFGGSNSGHYTCYSKHPIENNWYYYNDENVSQHMPRDDHLSSAYVLFYVRQDTNISFKIPDKSSYHFIDSVSHSSSSLTETTQNIEKKESRTQSMALVLYQPQPMRADSALYELPKEVPKEKDTSLSPTHIEKTPTEQTEPDSTYDFYS